MKFDLSHLNNSLERKQLVRALTIFRKLHKLSRLRARKLFDRTQNGVKISMIIIGQPIEQEEENYILSLFKKAFPGAPKPVFSINPKLEWGVRMSWGDEMVELSLDQIAK